MTLRGYAVSRHEDYRGLRLGWIVDVFADASDRDAKDALVWAPCWTTFRAAGVARAQAFAMHGPLGDDLRARGFRQAESPMQFCVRTARRGRTALRPRRAGTWCSATATWTDEAGGPS